MAVFTPSYPGDVAPIMADDYGTINDLNLTPFSIPGVTPNTTGKPPPAGNVALPPAPSTPSKTSTGTVSTTPPPSGSVPPNPSGAVDTGQTYSGAGPPPQYTPPPLQQAQYQKPKAGLEYLAAGLALLFPQSPIARVAAGFSGGLEQGAQNRYERAQQQAQTTNQNATAQAQAKYQNDTATWQYQQQLQQWQRERGIDPKTNQPFVLPAALAAKLASLSKLSPQDQISTEEQVGDFYFQSGSAEMAKKHWATADAIEKAQIEANKPPTAYERWEIEHGGPPGAADRLSIERKHLKLAEDNNTMQHERLRLAQRAGTLSREVPRLKAAAADAYQAYKDFWTRNTTDPTKMKNLPQLSAAIPPAAQKQLLGVFNQLDSSASPRKDADAIIEQATIAQDATTRTLLEKLPPDSRKKLEPVLGPLTASRSPEADANATIKAGHFTPTEAVTIRSFARAVARKGPSLQALDLYATARQTQRDFEAANTQAIDAAKASQAADAAGTTSGGSDDAGNPIPPESWETGN